MEQAKKLGDLFLHLPAFRTGNLMFEHFPIAPPDPVFGLLESFRQDPRAHKINLTVGVYQDELTRTPTLQCVQKAEAMLAQAAASKAYLPIDGSAPFNQALARLVLGTSHQAIEDGRVYVAQTPGGTGALRIAAELIASSGKGRRILVSEPTWANHYQIFEAAHLEIAPWNYLNPEGTGVDFDAAIEAVESAREGDAILLHTVCHNPTGFDFQAEQWRELLELITRRKVLPLFDFAYQGFWKSLDEDAAVVREFCGRGEEALICSSFSKNFGLYAERTGAITVVGGSSGPMKAMASQVKARVRTMWSTPPAHGAQIVATVLADQELSRLWHRELAGMRERIDRMRTRLVDELARRTDAVDFSFLRKQTGMFSFSGLSAAQARQLREQHAVYIVDSGRINIAGLNDANLGRVADAMTAVSATARV